MYTWIGGRSKEGQKVKNKTRGRIGEKNYYYLLIAPRVCFICFIYRIVFYGMSFEIPKVLIFFFIIYISSLDRYILR